MNASERKSYDINTIARACGYATLETRNNSYLDNRKLPVWKLKRMLEIAYEAGAKAAKDGEA